MFGRLLPKEGRFFDLFNAHAAQLVRAAHELTGLMANYESREDREQHMRVIDDAEHAADRITAEAIRLLHKTFITPLDREDIFNLSHGYDDMIKYSLTTIEEMQILAVAADEPIRRMLALVRSQSEELELAIQRLSKNPRLAGDHANAVHAKEAEVERIYRAAIRDLFARAADPQALPAIFYRREVYRHISNMSDRADYAATVFGMIVMKLA